jgi:hypothetical protein
MAPTLAEIVRQKLDDGRLPTSHPLKIWAGPGRGQPCTACDQPIGPAQVEYEFETGEQVCRFHVGCHGLWEAERRRRGLT